MFFRGNTGTTCINNQDLEEKIETTADELRRERRRFNTASLERDRIEKMSTKLKEVMRQLEGRLEKEEHISSEDADDILFCVGTKNHQHCMPNQIEEVVQ